MVGGLLASFDLTQPYTRICGGIVEHLLEVGFCHEMRAGTGGQIRASLHQLHCPTVDLAVSLDGVLERVTAFGECRGIQNDQVVVESFFVRRKLGEIIKYVSATKVHSVNQPVALCVCFCQRQGIGRNVYRSDVGSACLRRIQCERTGVGEAV